MAGSRAIPDAPRLLLCAPKEDSTSIFFDYFRVVLYADTLGHCLGGFYSIGFTFPITTPVFSGTIIHKQFLALIIP